MRTFITKLLVRLLLGRKEGCFRILRIGNRNIFIKIDSYIPASDFLIKAKKALHEVV